MTRNTDSLGDWPDIEKEYGAGLESIRSIAAKYGISEGRIRQVAKAKGWTRDLAEDVRRRVKRALLEDQAGLRTYASRVGGAQPTSEPDPERDEEIIEGATKTAVEVGRRHRTGLGKLRATAERLTSMLETYMDEADAEPIQDDPQAAAKTRRSAMLLGERDTAVTVTSKLAGVMARLIPLERLVYGISSAQGAQDAAKDAPRASPTPADMMGAAKGWSRRRTRLRRPSGPCWGQAEWEGALNDGLSCAHEDQARLKPRSCGTR